MQELQQVAVVLVVVVSVLVCSSSSVILLQLLLQELQQRPENQKQLTTPVPLSTSSCSNCSSICTSLYFVVVV